MPEGRGGFNETKYKALLEGLEISENNFSDLCSQELIFGSEFNSQKKKKALLKISSSFKVKDFFQLKSNLVTKINTESFVYDLTHSIGNFLREGEIENEIGSAKKEVVENDFIISRLRSYLKEFAVVQNKHITQLVSSEYLVYKQIDKRFSPNSLLAFCLTDEVQTILNCSQYGTEHPRLYDFVFEQLPIPECLLKLNSTIDNLFSKAHSNLERSKMLYAEAEAVLLAELGLPLNPLKGTLPPCSNETDVAKLPLQGAGGYAIKSFSNSFLKSGRLDAEYYQPKYDELETKIKAYKGGWDYVKSHFILNNKIADFAKPFYNYIEIGDINTGDGTASYNKIETSELPANAKYLIKKDDILISKVRPYRGAVSIINFEDENLIASGAFTILSENGKIKKETLALLLRTAPYKDWLLKWNVGSSYPVIKDENILNLPIPKLDLPIQELIASKIKESFTLKAESKRLLEEAKSLVEREIEK